VRYEDSSATSERRVIPLWRLSDPAPSLRAAALTRVGHSARLSRSPSLASAGCVRSFRGQVPAISDGVPLHDGGSRAATLAVEAPPCARGVTVPSHWGAAPNPAGGFCTPRPPTLLAYLRLLGLTVSALSGRGGFWLAADF
jgi:hypothetical protein